MIPVLAGISPRERQESVLPRGIIAKLLDQHLVAARALLDPKKLATPRKTRDLARGDRLMQPAEPLGNGVLGMLIPQRDGEAVVVVAAGKVHGNVATHAGHVLVARRLDQLVHAVRVEARVCVHADQEVDTLHVDAAEQELGHGGEKLGREDDARTGGPDVEVVQEAPRKDETVALAAVLVLDEAEHLEAFVHAAGHLHVHQGSIPGHVGPAHSSARANPEDVLHEIGGGGFGHAFPLDASVTYDEHGPFVVLDIPLGCQRVERALQLLKRLVVAWNQIDDVLGARGHHGGLRPNPPPPEDEKEGNGQDLHAVERQLQGDEGQVDIVVPRPPMGRKDENKAGRNRDGG